MLKSLRWKLLSHVQLYDTMDCSPPGSSVHGILQARILEWVAISFYKGSSQPRDWTCVFCLAGGLLHNRQILYQMNHQVSPIIGYVLVIYCTPNECTDFCWRNSDTVKTKTYIVIFKLVPKCTSSLGKLSVQNIVWFGRFSPSSLRTFITTKWWASSISHLWSWLWGYCNWN